MGEVQRYRLERRKWKEYRRRHDEEQEIHLLNAVKEVHLLNAQ